MAKVKARAPKNAKKVVKVRRRVKGNFMAARSFRMGTDTLKHFDNYCDRTGISRSELLRRFIGKLPAASGTSVPTHVRVRVAL